MDDYPVGFLRARLGEDAEADWHVLDCSGMPYGDGPCCEVQARIPREVEAKRAILALHSIKAEKRDIPPFDPYTGKPNADEYEVTCDLCGWASSDPASACETLRLLATVYRDHPDYRQPS